MITRATWFVAGAAAGVVGATYTRRKMRSVAAQLAPANVARGVAGRARLRGRDLVEAVREGRSAMRAKEDELRAGRGSGGPDLLGPGQLAPAQIIVLSDVRQLEELTRSRRVPVADDHPSLSPARPAARHRRGRR